MTTNKKGFAITAAETASTVYIYGGINMPDEDGFIVDDAEFVDEVNAIKSSAIDVRIASVGGDPMGAGVMYQSLVDHPAKVRTIVDKKAYSAGSMLLQAGDERIARPMAMVMVHGPATHAVDGRGSAQDHRKMADVIEAHADMMVPAYTRHGIEEQTVRSWLNSDTDQYFSAQAALDAGLIDKIEKSMPLAATAPTDYRIAAIGGKPAELLRVNHEDAKMADTEKQGAHENALDTDTIVAKHSRTVKRATQEGVKAEASRRKQITAVFTDFYDADPLNPVTALHDNCMEDTACTELEARRRIMAYLADASAEPIIARETYAIQPIVQAPMAVSQHLGGIPSRIAIGQDASEKMVEGATNALMAKAGYITDPKERKEAEAGGLMAMSLMEIGEKFAAMRGDSARTFSDPMLRAGHILAAHTSSDFPEVLANIAHKAAMLGYNEAPETWNQWCRVGNLTDFKEAKRVTTTAFPDLDEIPESGEYKHATISDVGEPIQLGTYGKRFRISRRAIINDDLSVFTDIPRKMGRAAARVPGNLAYAVLTANAALNQDAVTLFHADHNNLGTAGPPSITTLQEGFMDMALQQDPDANVVALNIEPSFLIVPRALRSTGKVLIGSEKDPTYDAANPGTPINEFYNSLTVISDGRLDASSAVVWYLAASPSQADTVEIAFLNGNQLPVVEQMETMSPDGRDYYVRLDCAAAALGYVGLYKNAGA